MSATSERICDHVSDAGPTVTHVRGTLIASSLQTLRELGHFARYEALLAREYHDSILFSLAMSWVPVEVATAHYQACDALALDRSQLASMGTIVSKRYADSFFGTILRTSRQAGLEGPWLALRSLGRIWDRIYQGGAILVDRTGPKDAYLEKRGLPLAQIPYFRSAFAAWMVAIGELLVRKMHVRFIPARDQRSFALAASWV